MIKNLFYKYLGTGKDSIEHNIDEWYVLTYRKDFIISVRETNGYWTRKYAYISQEVFDKIFKTKLIWPTEYKSVYGEEYLGSVLVRCENGDVLTSLSRNKEGLIFLYPAISYESSWSWGFVKMDTLPKRNIKVFRTKEEWEADKKKKMATSKAKRIQDDKSATETRKQAPVFSLKTPKFKIIEIVKDTKHLVGAKVGDIIYAEMPVITESNDRKFGSLHGYGSYTNWMDFYINGERKDRISPKIFPKLFFENILVEEV